MERLNYHHLLYFWTVGREGSVVRAAEKLRLSQPTISGQIRLLERAIGEPLFRREGKRLVLTDVGRMVNRYADEIFSVGRELIDALHERPAGRPMIFAVGVNDVVPKLIAYRLLQPALRIDRPIRIECYEGKPEALLARLSLHELDVVLSDAPVPPGIKVRAFSHLLGESGIAFCAAARLAARLRGRFPKSLDGMPMLLPTANTALRRHVDTWLESREIRPVVVGEFEDGALMNTFGGAGTGIFPIPAVIEADVRRQHGVRAIGHTGEVTERFYAITVERRIRQPAAEAIARAAHTEIFGRRPRRR